MSRTDQRREAVFRLYQADVTGRSEGEELSIFARDLVNGVEANREQLDRLIAENAIDWDLGRIAPLERALLRVALYEILHDPEVPAEVAIDEAVETAKLYCGSEAPGFVNGILGSVVRKETA